MQSSHALPGAPIRKRRRIPPRRRAEVLARGICAYCGSSRDDLQVDHIHPRSRGGTDEIDNLACACRWCNVDKGDLPIEEWAAKRISRGRSWPPDPWWTPADRQPA